jgi:ketosteroid isomerase-like protein
MSSQTNLELVRSLYAAFGRGDIPAIIAALAGHATWTVHGPANLVPTFGTFHGPAGVTRFFGLVGEHLALIGSSLGTPSPRATGW